MDTAGASRPGAHGMTIPLPKPFASSPIVAAIFEASLRGDAVPAWAHPKQDFLEWLHSRLVRFSEERAIEDQNRQLGTERALDETVLKAALREIRRGEYARLVAHLPGNAEVACWSAAHRHGFDFFEIRRALRAAWTQKRKLTSDESRRLQDILAAALKARQKETYWTPGRGAPKSILRDALLQDVVRRLLQYKGTEHLHRNRLPGLKITHDLCTAVADEILESVNLPADWRKSGSKRGGVDLLSAKRAARRGRSAEDLLRLARRIHERAVEESRHLTDREQKTFDRYMCEARLLLAKPG